MPLPIDPKKHFDAIRDILDEIDEIINQIKKIAKEELDEIKKMNQKLKDRNENKI